MRLKIKEQGFTLLEVLIALFVFTILSTILVGALHSVMNAVSGTEAKAEKLRNLQIALIMLSRDVEQTINRPILDSNGGEELAFRGSPRSFTFTHTGYANPVGSVSKSSLQRTQYFWDEDKLLRATWDVLDQAPKSQARTRAILEQVTNANFQYLDEAGRFNNNWPPDGEGNEAIPRAVKINLTLSHWGKISQIYAISAQAIKIAQKPPAEKEN